MDLTRRQLFQWAARLGTAAAAAGCALARSGSAAASSPAGLEQPSQKGMLVDTTRCVGCGACEWACQNRWGLDGSAPDGGLSPQRWTWVRPVDLGSDTRYVRTQCFHCLDPSCVSACPVAALVKTEEGAVTYDESRCIGCRYCMMACPFQIPRYEWASWNPAVTKCLFCHDRLAQGEEPACASACPTGATLFGDRDDLLREARARIERDPDRYVPYIYGEQEVGGTAWLFLSDVPFEELGFRTDVPLSAPPRRTARVMSLVPPLAGGLAVALGAVAWWNGNHEAGGTSRSTDPPTGRSDGPARGSTTRR